MKKNNNKFLIGVIASISVAALIGGLTIGTLVKVYDLADDVGQTEKMDETENDNFEFQLLHYSDIDGGRNIVDYVQRFAAMQKKFTDEYENTLALASGDLWIAGPEYNIAGDSHAPGSTDYFGTSPKPGRAHMQWANQLGIKASGFGNHEFDQGTGAISDIITANVGWEGAAFPYIVTNMDFSEDENLGSLVVPGGQDVESIRGKITDYATVMVGGEKIGLVGAIYPDLDKITSLGGAKMIDRDYDTFQEKLQHVAMQLQEDVDALRAMGVNKIIALTHFQQLQYERDIASMLDGVDIIMGGGSNEILFDATDVPRSSDKKSDPNDKYDSYPVEKTSKTNEPVMIVNVDGDFTYLGRLVVKFDKDGVLMPDSYDPTISGAYASTPQVLAHLGLTEEDAPKLITDTALAIKDELVQKRGNVFGYTNVYMNGERAFVRTEESNLGDLVVDSKVAYARRFHPDGIMVGIQNGGGIRGPIGSCIYPPGSTDLADLECRAPLADPSIPVDEGAISELDIQTIMKFNNGIVLLTINAGYLKEIFEDGLSEVTEGSTRGAFPQISNLQLEYYIDGTPVVRDANGAITTPGEKVKTLTIIDSDPTTAGDQPMNVVTDGQIVEANKDTEIILVAPDWLSAFGKAHDGYKSLGNIPEDKRVALREATAPTGFTATLGDQGREQEAFAWYMNDKYGTLASAYDIEDEDRETKDVAGTPPADTRIVKLHKPA